MKGTGDAVDEEIDVLKGNVNTESVEKVASIFNVFCGLTFLEYVW